MQGGSFKKIVNGTRRRTWQRADGGAVDVAGDVAFPEPGPAPRFRKEVAALRFVAAVVAVPGPMLLFFKNIFAKKLQKIGVFDSKQS
jgi:hypothetical protein